MESSNFYIFCKYMYLLKRPSCIKILKINKLINKIDRNFYSRLRICNCKSVWSADSLVKKLTLIRKKGSSLKKKTVSLKDLFSSKSKYIKKVVFKAKVVIQNSVIKCYHEFHLRPREDLEMLIQYWQLLFSY